MASSDDKYGAIAGMLAELEHDLENRNIKVGTHEFDFLMGIVSEGRNLWPELVEKSYEKLVAEYEDGFSDDDD